MPRGPVVSSIRFNFLPALFFAAFFLSIAPDSLAQTVQVDRAELLRSQLQPQPPFVPTTSPDGIDDGRAAASPNDADLGEQAILQRAEEYKPFTVAISAPFYYTSNVGLTRTDEHGDFLVAPAAALFYQPRLTRTLYALLDVRQQFFYYNRFNGLDFASFNADAGLTYFLPQFYNLILHGRYDYNRLTSSDRVFDEFFSNHSFNLGAELPFQFGRAHQLSIGGDIDISLAADRQAPRRNDYDAYVGYSLHVTRSFSLDTAARIVLRDYANDRDDVSGIFAASVNYRLTNWWTMSVISSYAISRSNQSVFDYNVGNIGGAISLSLSF
jgi:hypothetical protein